MPDHPDHERKPRFYEPDHDSFLAWLAYKTGVILIVLAMIAFGYYFPGCADQGPNSNPPTSPYEP